MKPCFHRFDAQIDGYAGCDNYTKLMHNGIVPIQICEMCPYAEAEPSFAQIDALLINKKHRGKINKPCSGCLGPKRRTTKGSHDLQFVWPYWHGGANGDEIRFSVRSVENFYEGTAKCTVIGDKPPWFTGHYIPQQRVPKRTSARAYRDMLTKVWTMATHSEIDDDFIWMMDDIYFLKFFVLEDLQTPRAERWHSSDYNTWQRLKGASMEALTAAGHPNHDYATHMPHYAEKEKLVKLFEDYDLHNKTMLWEILYGNAYRDTPARARPFFARVGKPMEPDQLQVVTRRSTVLNHSAGGWCDGMRNYLLALMPDRASCESDVEANPIIKKAQARVVKRRPVETHRGYVKVEQ